MCMQQLAVWRTVDGGDAVAVAVGRIALGWHIEGPVRMAVHNCDEMWVPS